MITILDKLKEYSNSDYYGFHMPGHKRNTGLIQLTNPYKIDITEIDGFDDLHHAEGLLKTAQERAARLYHGEETHFLINGSTAGILSAILGVTKKGDTVLVARNCHKSVYHAIYLNELHPVYLYPTFRSDVLLNTGIATEDVKATLADHPEAKAVILVSPTYDGVMSDVAAISKVVHERGIPLIVDEAHGAHFGFHPYFPDNSNVNGADIVIHSLHKTLPALTQTALLHMNGTIVERGKVRDYLHMLQTSSPSYVLMASIDSCMELLDVRREELFSQYVAILDDTRERLAKLEHLRLVETDCFDRSKLVISTGKTAMTGRQLYKLLLETYHLQMEMAAGTYVLGMTSIGDTKEGMDRLVESLFAIDKTLGDKTKGSGSQQAFVGRFPFVEQVYSSADMQHMKDQERCGGIVSAHLKSVSWKNSVDTISTEYVYLYPPGCPLLVPGEKISQEAVDMLQWYQEYGFSIEGIQQQGYIEVWVNG